MTRPKEQAARPTAARSQVSCRPFAPKLPKNGSVADLVELMRAHLHEIAQRGNPVIAGPFTTEVGFELLYWIPLLRWAVETEPSLEGRLTILSRGGPFSWYEPLFSGYVDGFALASVEEFVSRRSSQKQRELTPFEGELCEQARQRLGFGEVDVIHPALLFNTYYHPTVKRQKEIWVASVDGTDDAPSGFASRYTRIPLPDSDAIASELPSEYVAMRFYFRESFPDTPENRDFVKSTLEKLTDRTHVVLLNTGMELDEHVDWMAADRSSVHTLDHLMTPGNNLHVQTLAIGRANAFVGTYGGLSYLPPFLGVRSIAFSSDPGQTKPWHLDLARAVFDRPGWGSLAALDVAEAGFLDSALAELDTHGGEPELRVRT